MNLARSRMTFGRVLNNFRERGCGVGVIQTTPYQSSVVRLVIRISNSQHHNMSTVTLTYALTDDMVTFPTFIDGVALIVVGACLNISPAIASAITIAIGILLVLVGFGGGLLRAFLPPLRRG